MKNKFDIIKKFFFIKIFVSFFFIFSISTAGELDITADEILINQDDQTVTAVGDLVVYDEEKNNITGNQGTYYKKKELLEAIGSVLLLDTENNQIETDRITYNLKEKEIKSFNNSKLKTKDDIKIFSNQFNYFLEDKVITSNEFSNLIDTAGNEIFVDSFKYSLSEKLFSSKGYIKLIDEVKNEFFFDEIHMDTKSKELVGSKVRIWFDKSSIEGSSPDNEPRFVANSGIINPDKWTFDKGMYTVCKKRGNKCPPWLFKAKKIVHDKIKKTIYYTGAWLKVYDVPIFYFPKFMHPDPSVARRSGFLGPQFSEQQSTGFALTLPYFWAISDNKDLTFTPKFYTGTNALYSTEYRQETENTSLILDTSYSRGYKKVGGQKNLGPRNHLFGKWNVDLDIDGLDESNIDFNFQRVSNDTYLRVHEINTAKETGLVDHQESTLLNEIDLNLEKDDAFFRLQARVWENTTKTDNTRYEYDLPRFTFGNKILSSDSIGDLDWQTIAFYKQHNNNTKENFFINHLRYNSVEKNNKNIITKLDGVIKNVNYDTKNSSTYKTEGMNQEINGALGLTTYYPLEKVGDSYFETLSPKAMLRFAPGHMRNLSDSGLRLNNQNIFDIEKIGDSDVVENGTSFSYGFDYRKEANIGSQLKLNSIDFSLGQILNFDKNDDMPLSSSLDQNISDIVGNLTLDFNEFANIKYDFLFDKDFNDNYYNLISSSFNLGKFNFNTEFLDENAHVGNESYINNALTIAFDDSNSLNFETRKNFKTESTEFYNFYYEYINDCLSAAVEFKRKFYTDRDIEPENSIRFTLSIIPLQTYRSPSIKKFKPQNLLFPK